jgi:hypothetical protein
VLKQIVLKDEPRSSLNITLFLLFQITQQLCYADTSNSSPYPYRIHSDTYLCRIHHMGVSDTPRGVSDYFGIFDRQIRSIHFGYAYPIILLYLTNRFDQDTRRIYFLNTKYTNLNF